MFACYIARYRIHSKFLEREREIEKKKKRKERKTELLAKSEKNVTPAANVTGGEIRVPSISRLHTLS